MLMLILLSGLRVVWMLGVLVMCQRYMILHPQGESVTVASSLLNIYSNSHHISSNN
jgi:hypothetical protein